MELRDLFKNQDATEFCIVTIPTQLAIAESKRLLAALNTQGVAVRNIVVNQVHARTHGHCTVSHCTAPGAGGRAGGGCTPAVDGRRSSEPQGRGCRGRAGCLIFFVLFQMRQF